MDNQILQYLLYLGLLVALAVPLGGYIGKVMNSERVLLSRVLAPVENGVYKLLHINTDEQMSWKRYAVSIVLFSVFGFALLFLLTLAQGILPLNPQAVPGTGAHLAFNTTASFVTNTNWQSYDGESQLSFLTQMLGLTTQNFVSAAVGISVMFALIRGFVRVKQKGLGCFWADLTRIVLYILLPLSLAVTLLIASQGVVQSLSPYTEVDLLAPVTVMNDDGGVTTVTKAVVPQGPAAGQAAIKLLGTNGGGFFGANSAHPLENPTPFSNLVQMLSLLLIPVACCFTFGRNVKDKRQGRALFMAMFILLTGFLSVIAVNENLATPQLAQGGAVSITEGNMEGKETRFGMAASNTWAAFTTAASNGAVNSMHDSYTPLGGMIPMLQMQLGEVVFGGVGSGLYGMVGFAILTVFIAGLMVGRTPEYLGKKIEPHEMRMAVLVCLATPAAILIGAGLATGMPANGGYYALGNSGAHGFSEVLYALSSAGGNNGSSFAGLGCNFPFMNLLLGCVMLFVRFVPMMATLSIAGSLVGKRTVAASAGTLPTHNALFVGLLIFVVLLVGALSFFPALALGPIAEFFQMNA